MGIFSFLFKKNKIGIPQTSLKKSKLINSNRGGYLSFYDLWDFWDSLTESSKNKILNYYEETPLMFDPAIIFQGEYKHIKGNPKDTPIYILNMFLVSADVELLDDCYAKFTEYNPKDYGASYWIDSHFFISNFSEIAYKLFINNKCDDSRFIIAFEFQYHNQLEIVKSLKKRELFPVRNQVFEQYLIYLEKKKLYNEVIVLSSQLISFGWTNNFNKRIDRCRKKEIATINQKEN